MLNVSDEAGEVIIELHSDNETVEHKIVRAISMHSDKVGSIKLNTKTFLYVLGVESIVRENI